MSNKIFSIGGSRFEVKEELGSGAFGTVYKVVESQSCKEYAVKEIKIESSDDHERQLESINKEIKALQRCGEHPGIVQLFDVGYENQSVLIRMEYCDGGNLNNRLAKTTSNDERDLRWMSELADAVRFLHSKGIVHRDLKPENVLLTSTNAIKLADFGLAREYTALKQGESSYKAYLQYMTNYMGTLCGTLSWVAPEVFEEHYTEKADVFSLGCIFYSILSREHVTAGGEKFFGAFVTFRGQLHGIGKAMFESKQQVELPFNDKIPHPRRKLITGMLEYNPKKRPSAEKVRDDVENIRTAI